MSGEREGHWGGGAVHSRRGCSMQQTLHGIESTLKLISLLIQVLSPEKNTERGKHGADVLLPASPPGARPAWRTPRLGQGHDPQASRVPLGDMGSALENLMASPSACETAGGLTATRRSRRLVSQTREQLCPGNEGQADRREQERRVSWQLVNTGCSQGPAPRLPRLLHGLRRNPTLLHVLPAAASLRAAPAPRQRRRCLRPPRLALSTWRPCGRSANKLAGGDTGCPAPRPPQTRTERPGGPVRLPSGVCRSPWPPGRTGGRPPDLACPSG